MIKNKEDYLLYLSEDRRVNQINTLSKAISSYTWKYLKRLRFAEYITNVFLPRYRIIGTILLKVALFRLHRISVLTGISIPRNSFGKGLSLPHYGYIVVNTSAKFGEFCTIQCGVNISANVQGGDYVYLGTGAKIMKNVKLADGIIVGANAVVTKSFLTTNIVVAGIPALQISSNGNFTRTDSI